MIRICLFCLSMLLPFLVFPKDISPERASLVALNFYAQRSGVNSMQSYKELGVSDLKIHRDQEGQILYYTVAVNKGGFVLVSAWDAVIPVLAYGFKGTFSAAGCNVSAWMKHYERQIQFSRENPLFPSEIITQKWSELENWQPGKSVSTIASVSPLLVSQWNQDSFYNEECPEDPAGPEGHCYAGCVATAMGQLLYYYRFPLMGQGSYSYNHPDYGTIAADFGSTTYDWNGMPTSISSSNAAIATLLFHQGVSVDMDYGPDGSGMWNHKAAYSLKTHFRYGPETQYYFRDSISLDWDSILVVNLNQGKPLYYAGWAGVQSDNGHAFVCDGYQGTDYFHFNWGWGGQSDGYFYINNLNPGGSNFNFAQEVIPLFPDTLQNAYPSYCNGHTVLHQLRGSIEDGSGWYSYAPNSNCSWLIEPQDPLFDSITRIRLTFTRMDTEAGVDKVLVYDGDSTTAPLIGEYSGSSLPAMINSSGNKLFLVFQSNGSIQQGGWQVDFEPVLPVYCTGTSTITDFSGEIGDGSGSKNYNNNTICRWKLLPTDAVSLTLAFTSFNLPDTLDKLRVYDLGTMELLASLTGSELPGPITAGSGKMMLLFNTNKAVPGPGWDGYFTGSAVAVEEIPESAYSLEVTANPSEGNVILTYHSDVPGKALVQVYSATATLLQEKSIWVTAGKNQVQLDLQSMSPSLLLLKLSHNNRILSKKIITN